MKYKKSFLTAGIIIVIILLFLFARTNFISLIALLRKVLTAKVLINSVIISAISYFLIPWMFSGWFKNSESKIGRWHNLFLILLSVIISYQITYSGNGYRYIWEVGLGSELYQYFFDRNTGLFRGARLGIFIGASVLFIWMFSALMKTEEKHNKFFYALAVFLAAQLTKEGIGIATLVLLGEFTAALLINKTLKQNMPANWSWPLTLGLTRYLAYSIFKEKAFGRGFPVNLIGATGTIIAILIIGFVFWRIKKIEDKEKSFGQHMWSKIQKSEKIGKLMGRKEKNFLGIYKSDNLVIATLIQELKTYIKDKTELERIQKYVDGMVHIYNALQAEGIGSNNIYLANIQLIEEINNTLTPPDKKQRLEALRISVLDIITKVKSYELKIYYFEEKYVWRDYNILGINQRNSMALKNNAEQALFPIPPNLIQYATNRIDPREFLQYAIDDLNLLIETLQHGRLFEESITVNDYAQAGNNPVTRSAGSPSENNPAYDEHFNNYHGPSLLKERFRPTFGLLQFNMGLLPNRNPDETGAYKSIWGIIGYLSFRLEKDIQDEEKQARLKIELLGYRQQSENV